MFPSQNRAAQPPEPLSEEQAKAQVIDPAKQIAKVTDLPDLSGTFEWESCNDQGDPPYRGRVDMLFTVPAGVDRQAYFQQIAATMAGQSGWSAGPPPGMRPFGAAVHKDGVMVIIGESGTVGHHGSIRLFGECRNMQDHHNDNGFQRITNELTGG